MGDSAPQLQAMLATLRDAGTGQRACLRLHRIQALAARAARLEGSVRALVEARLERLAPDPAGPMPVPDTHAIDGDGDGDGSSALALLLADLATARLARRTVAPMATPAQPQAHAAPVLEQASAIAHPDGPAFADLPALAGFRSTWARLRTTSQLQDALADVPEDAGPMHSTVLVHRALALMHAQAPGYLQHFLGYLDALAGLERISPAPATTPAPRCPRPPPPPSTASASRPRTAPRPRSRGRRRPG